MPRMDNYQGDLTDIVRASGGAYGCGSGPGASEPIPDWQFPSDPMNFSPAIEEPRDNFGDPFGYIRDPLLHELDVSGSGFFSSPSSAEMMGTGTASVDDKGGFCGGGAATSTTTTVLAQKNYLDHEMKRPCNIFSRMLQISPNAKLPVSPRHSPPVMAASSPRGISHMINANNTSKDCFVDHTAGVQISPPRNPGIKRRSVFNFVLNISNFFI
jgi:hypothetical protein